MSQQPQLGYGARQLIEYIKLDLETAYEAAGANVEVKNAIHKAIVKIDTELADMLRRRGPGEPTQEMRIKDLERKVKELENTVSAYFQHAAQHI